MSNKIFCNRCKIEINKFTSIAGGLFKKFNWANVTFYLCSTCAIKLINNNSIKLDQWAKENLTPNGELIKS